MFGIDDAVLIPAAAGVAGAGMNMYGGGAANQASADIARDTRNYNWQMYLNQVEREDNAVQRRAADLEKAGLSKTLAAGGGAEAGQPIRATPWEYQNVGKSAGEGMINGAIAAMNIMKQSADISQTQAQVDLTRKQTEAADIAIKQANITNPLEAERRQLENDLNRLTNPEKVKSIVAEVQSKNLGNEIKKIEVDREAVKLVNDRIDTTLKSIGVYGQLAENVSKLIANRIASHNLAWAQKHGVPTTGLDFNSRVLSWGEKNYEGIRSAAENLAKDLIKKAQGANPVPKAQSPWQRDFERQLGK